jgi:hypothetical protein
MNDAPPGVGFSIHQCSDIIFLPPTTTKSLYALVSASIFKTTGTSLFQLYPCTPAYRMSTMYKRTTQFF